MSIFESFRLSARSLRSPLTLSMVGLLTAIYVVLQFVAPQPTEWLKITFSFLPLAVAGMLFGPVPAALAGGVGDILQFLIKPTGPYFPGFTLSAILGGLLYGLFLYRKSPTVGRLCLCRFVVVLLLNIGLNSVFLHLLYGSELFVWMRVVKNLAVFPIDALLLCLLFRVLTRVIPRRLLDDTPKI